MIKYRINEIWYEDSIKKFPKLWEWFIEDNIEVEYLLINDVILNIPHLKEILKP